MAIGPATDRLVDVIRAEYERRTPRSKSLFEAASRVVPSGSSRGSIMYLPYPFAVDAGREARVTDVDGNEYLDFLNCHSALVHGHAFPAIVQAITSRAERSTAWSAASEDEGRLARLLCERVRSVEMIRFCNSGTEAGMYAVRLARAFTGREKILKFEGGMHGTYDELEVSKAFSVADAGPPDDPQPVPGTLGFPRDLPNRVVVAPFNDREVVARRIREHAADLAAVIVEPALGWGGQLPAQDGFLPFLREITHEHGVLLIADEVVTFRLASGGAQELFGFDADLTMFGELIGGGLPVGAVGGRADILMQSGYDLRSTTRSRLSLSGTFHANPAVMTAGIASVEALDRVAIERINVLGERMRRSIEDVFAELRIHAQVTGIGSLLHLHFTDEPLREYRAVARASKAAVAPLHLWLLNHGVCPSQLGWFNISTVMRDQDIDDTVALIRVGLIELRPWLRSIVPHLVTDG